MTAPDINTLKGIIYFINSCFPRVAIEGWQEAGVAGASYLVITKDEEPYLQVYLRDRGGNEKPWHDETAGRIMRGLMREAAHEFGCEVVSIEKEDNRIVANFKLIN